MGESRYGFIFNLVQKVVQIVLPHYKFERPPIKGKPVVYISHHQNMIGPLSILAWIKYYVRTWVLSEFTEREATYQQY